MGSNFHQFIRVLAFTSLSGSKNASLQYVSNVVNTFSIERIKISCSSDMEHSQQEIEILCCYFFLLKSAFVEFYAAVWKLFTNADNWHLKTRVN